jgi:flagellar motor protein MotB
LIGSAILASARMTVETGNRKRVTGNKNMGKKEPPKEEKGETAPLWIISFADMISLLMAFFVMLLTLATAKSGNLCNEGIGIFEHSMNGFRRTIAGFGVPELFGSGNEALEFDTDRAHFALDSKDEQQPGQRTVDGAEEKTRRLFQVLDRQAHTFKSQVRGKSPEFTAAPIQFGQNDSRINEQAANYLSQFTIALGQAQNPENLSIYIVGFDPNATTIKDQWVNSARRAQATAAFIQNKLGPGSKIKIFSWGGGAGGEWSAGSGTVSRGAEILIAVLNGENK